MFTSDYVLIGIILFAAFAVREWFEHKKPIARPARVSKMKRLIIDLDDQDYDAVAHWATKNSQSPEDFAKTALVGSVPTAERERIEDKTTPALIDRVFDLAEEQEERDAELSVGSEGLLPPAPRRRPMVGVPTEAERTHPMQRVIRQERMTLPTVPPGPHPCVHLSTTRTPPNLRHLAQGICEHPKQNGKPCYFSPTIALKCDLAETRESLKLPPGSRGARAAR